MRELNSKDSINTLKSKAKNMVNSIKENPTKWTNTAGKILDVAITGLTFVSAFKGFKSSKPRR